MRILMVNKFLYPNGGSETYTFSLGETLAAMGHEVEYFGMDSDSRCVSNSIGVYTDNVDFRNAGALAKIKYSTRSIYSFEAKKKIAKVLDAFKPDIVHLNNINFQLTLSIIDEINKRNIPIVQTAHDTQAACPNHRMYIEQEERVCTLCTNGKYSACMKNKCIHGSTMKSAVAMLESYLNHKRGTYNLVDRYICPSNFMKGVLSQSGIDESRLTVMHNFADMPDERYSDKKDYVLYFGRFSVEKGIKTLLQACKELPEIKFVFAGSGPLEEDCKSIDNIELAGFKSGEELRKLVGEAAFSVCPSEWFENCPMSVIESITLGTPVIGSDLGGIPELIKNGETGLIFKAGDKEALKSAISSLISDKERLAKMQNNCTNSNDFSSLNEYTDEILTIYNELVTQ